VTRSTGEKATGITDQSDEGGLLARLESDAQFVPVADDGRPR